jgi:hypothetical protein
MVLAALALVGSLRQRAAELSPALSIEPARR